MDEEKDMYALDKDWARRRSHLLDEEKDLLTG